MGWYGAGIAGRKMEDEGNQWHEKNSDAFMGTGQ